MRGPGVTETALLADIGGTSARFALARDGALGPVVTQPVTTQADPLRAMREALDKLRGEAAAPTRAAVAVAGPVAEGRAALTNGVWRIDASSLRLALGLSTLDLINDFEAIAWSLPALTEGDLFPIGVGRPVPRAPRVVLGPGTGLGVAAMIPVEDRWLVLPSQGGHVTLAPGNERESRILDYLRIRFGHVSAERVLSGAGLVVLAQAIAAIDRGGPTPGTPARILEAARSGGSPLCVEAFGRFCSLLGTVAGNLALTYEARGGVYLAGGILPRAAEALAASEFRDRFEAKGRFAGFVSAIPTWLIRHPQPGLLGLAQLLAACGR